LLELTLANFLLDTGPPRYAGHADQGGLSLPWASKSWATTINVAWCRPGKRRYSPEYVCTTTSQNPDVAEAF